MGLGFSLLLSQQVVVLLIAMILTGMGIGACFSLCMTLFSIRSRTTAGSTMLSGFGQSIGYWVAALGPFILGVAHDHFHGWTIAIILFFVMVVGVFAAGMYATQNAYIEDR